MTLAVKIISGATGSLLVSAAPISYVGYTTWDKNNPTGETWLLNSGYSFNKPAFKSQDSLRHGCVENLFSNSKDKTDPTKDTKVYGCAVMSMDLYGTSMPFRFNETAKNLRYINFNSEVVVRKGEDGWVINSKVDNYSNDLNTYFDYVLTTYKYKDNKWSPEGERKWFKDKGTMSGSPISYTISDSKNVQYHISRYDKKLVIKVPKEAPWWNSVNWVSPVDGSSSDTKNKVDEKHWSGVWIDDSSHGEDSWIFQDIELYIEDKKYSQVFCKGENTQCFEVRLSNEKLKKSDKLGSDNWKEMFSKTPSNETTTVSNMLKDTMKPIINKLENSRGSWLKLEKVCGLKDIRNLDDSQKKQLSMFCAKGNKA